MRLRIETAPRGRVIAVSDVHGHADYLRGLMERVQLTASDALVIVGDLLEKGPKNLETLRLIMRIRETTPVYWVMGNCDPVTDERDDLTSADGVRRWIEMSPQRLYRDMMAEAGMGLETLDDMDAFWRALDARFAPELAMLKNLPHVLQMGRYTFVHGGITNAPLASHEPYSVMKNDAFLAKGFAFDRWVVVGHWPVQLLDRTGQSAAPHVERARHIVSIDGGCVLKDAGQLNAMIIPDVNADTFTFAHYDALETFIAPHAQAEKPPTVSVLYTDCAVEVLQNAGEMCTVRLRSDGRVFRAPTLLLYERNGETRLDDYTDYELPVQAGDVLARVYTLPEGVYAKDAAGCVGWYKYR